MELSAPELPLYEIMLGDSIKQTGAEGSYSQLPVRHADADAHGDVQVSEHIKNEKCLKSTMNMQFLLLDWQKATRIESVIMKPWWSL